MPKKLKTWEAQRLQKHKVIGEFFVEFFKYLRPWAKEMVAKYKEERTPILPTFISGYYKDSRDIEIAVLSAYCMDWNRNVYEQVQAMRKLIGEHPWEWFENRSFVLLSIPKEQDKFLCIGGIGAKYWEIARFFDRLYMHCKSCNTFDLGSCFPPCSGKVYKSKLLDFATDACDCISVAKAIEYKTSVIELVFRTSDGIGLGIWASTKQGERCPRSIKMGGFIRMWFDDFDKFELDFFVVINWFGFDKSYDFFYFWLAWQELSKANPKACSKLATVVRSRFRGRYLVVGAKWKEYIPEIRFE